VGWGQRISVAWDAGRRAHHTQRSLLPGRYQYKLIFDGRWSYDADHPLLEVGVPGAGLRCTESLMFVPGLLVERGCCLLRTGWRQYEQFHRCATGLGACSRMQTVRCWLINCQLCAPLVLCCAFRACPKRHCLGLQADARGCQIVTTAAGNSEEAAMQLMQMCNVPYRWYPELDCKVIARSHQIRIAYALMSVKIAEHHC
jgi:hypothetical protein